MTDDRDEKAKAFDPPAIYTNRVLVSRSMQGTRLSFGEVTDGDARYRAAVMMADADAVALRDLLNSMFPPTEKQN